MLTDGTKRGLPCLLRKGETYLAEGEHRVVLEPIGASVRWPHAAVMKPTAITRVAISGVLALTAGAGIACSSKADASSFDSAYCHNIRSSVAGDLRHVDDRSANPEKAGWQRYVRFMDEGLRTAPREL